MSDNKAEPLNPTEQAPPGVDQTDEGWPHPATYPPHMVRMVDAIQERARKHD